MVAVDKMVAEMGGSSEEEKEEEEEEGVITESAVGTPPALLSRF